MNTDPMLHLIHFRGRKMIGNRESMPHSVLAGAFRMPSAEAQQRSTQFFYLRHMECA
jgi:hypothetical protein